MARRSRLTYDYDPEHRLTRPQAHRAREDFACILDELDFLTN